MKIKQLEIRNGYVIQKDARLCYPGIIKIIFVKVVKEKDESILLKDIKL